MGILAEESLLVFEIAMSRLLLNSYLISQCSLSSIEMSAQKGEWPELVGKVL